MVGRARRACRADAGGVARTGALRVRRVGARPRCYAGLHRRRRRGRFPRADHPVDPVAGACPSPPPAGQRRDRDIARWPVAADRAAGLAGAAGGLAARAVLRGRRRLRHAGGAGCADPRRPGLRTGTCGRARAARPRCRCVVRSPWNAGARAGLPHGPGRGRHRVAHGAAARTAGWCPDGLLRAHAGRQWTRAWPRLGRAGGRRLPAAEPGTGGAGRTGAGHTRRRSGRRCRVRCRIAPAQRRGSRARTGARARTLRGAGRPGRRHARGATAGARTGDGCRRVAAVRSLSGAHAAAHSPRHVAHDRTTARRRAAACTAADHGRCAGARRAPAGAGDRQHCWRCSCCRA